MMRVAGLWGLVLLALLAPLRAVAEGIRVKDLGHFEGWRDYPLVGFGLVTGLSGSGDSPRSLVTRQAIRNTLNRLGTSVSADQIQSRNVALVTVTAVLPPSGHKGDRIDATVSSLGDARSLAGGSLVMTPLQGPDQKVYALAQGGLVVGGYRFDADQNRQQKNYPTSAQLPGGATIETPVSANLLNERDELNFILDSPDVTTAERIAAGIDDALGARVTTIVDGKTIRISSPRLKQDLYRTVGLIERVTVSPDSSARIVINERSGTVVAGGDVQVSRVVISQGDIRVSVRAENQASQPFIAGEVLGGDQIRSLVITNSQLKVAGGGDSVTASFPNSTIADLVEGLRQQHVATREVIGILQALKAAGALHAELIVQ